MTQIKLKHIHEFADRHGKVRRYVRLPGGKRIPLPGRPGSTEFMSVYQAALDGIEPIQKAPIGASRTLTGSIDAAIVGYYGHNSFTSLAQVTRTARRQALERFRRAHGTKPIAALRPQHLTSILAQTSPGSAAALVFALKALMSFAQVTGLIGEDPAIGLKPPKKQVSAAGIHSWTEEEIAAYRACHAIGTTARLALELALNTAVRRGDLLQIGPQHIRNGLFTYTQKKTDAQVAMPVHPDLLSVLDATPTGSLLFLTSSVGTPFSANTFGNKFREWCRAAGLENCSVHGLRKAQARRLAEAGCSAHEIASITGHKTISEVQRYADAANRRLMATSAIASVTATFGTKR